MAIKREKMDKMMPKIEGCIIAAYLAARILGDVKSVRKTVAKAKKKRIRR